MYTGGDLDFETPTVQCSGRKFLSFGFHQSFMRYENSPYHSNFLRFLGILPFIKCKQSFEVISQANNQQKQAGAELCQAQHSLSLDTT